MAQKTANSVNDVLAVWISLLYVILFCRGADCFLQSLENVIRADTESTIGDLDLLNRINLHAKERYQAMANAAEGLGTDSEYLSQKCSSARYHHHLD